MTENKKNVSLLKLGLLYSTTYIVFLISSLKDFNVEFFSISLFVFFHLMLSIGILLKFLLNNKIPLLLFFGVIFLFLYLSHYLNSFEYHSPVYHFQYYFVTGIVSFAILYFSKVENNHKEKIIQFTFWISLFLISLFFTMFPHYKYFVFFKDPGDIHLKSDLYALSTLIALQLVSPGWFFILFVYFSYVIGVIGSRIAFISFLISAFLIFYLKIKKINILKKTIYLYLIFLLVFLLTLFLQSILISISELERVATIFFEGSNDPSAVARKYQFQMFINKISFGSFKDFMLGGGAELGEYVHNILSLWQHFNIFVFLFVSFIIFLALTILFVKQKEYNFVFPTYIYLLLTSFLGRSFVSSHVIFILFFISLFIIFDNSIHHLNSKISKQNKIFIKDVDTNRSSK